MRLIDADEAIKALGVAYFDKGIQSAKDDPCVIDAMTDWAIRQIKAMPTIGGWIPCSERLPEKAGIYLCTVGAPYRNPREMRYAPQEWADKSDNATWRSTDGSYVYDWFVEAWQPLPEPYSIESDGIEEENDE